MLQRDKRAISPEAGLGAEMVGVNSVQQQHLQHHRGVPASSSFAVSTAADPSGSGGGGSSSTPATAVLDLPASTASFCPPVQGATSLRKRDTAGGGGDGLAGGQSQQASNPLPSGPPESDGSGAVGSDSLGSYLLLSLATWLRLLLNFAVLVGATIGQAIYTVAVGLAALLFPIYVLIPKVVFEKVVNFFFFLGYRIYLTRVGEWLHHLTLWQMKRAKTPAHSKHLRPTRLKSCDVLPIPLMSDNYAYLIVDRSSNHAAVVDPCDPEEVLRVVNERACQLTMVLTTHRHHDHAGGNRWLLARYPRLRIVGGIGEGSAGVTKELAEGEVLWLGTTSIMAIATPCHTAKHVVFAVAGSGDAPREAPVKVEDTEAVFTGDALFVGGVGAFFHGNGKDMHNSLCVKMAPLPNSAYVFVGHEYTLDHLRFAKWLEPQSQGAAMRCKWATIRRSVKAPTVPSSLCYERQFNPYMRVGTPELAKICEAKLSSIRSSKQGGSKRLRRRKARAQFGLTKRTSSGDSPSDAFGNDGHPNVGTESWSGSDHILLNKTSDLVQENIDAVQHLFGIWIHSEERRAHLPACCELGICMRRTSCSGFVYDSHQMSPYALCPHAELAHVEQGGDLNRKEVLAKQIQGGFMQLFASAPKVPGFGAPGAGEDTVLPGVDIREFQPHYRSSVSDPGGTDEPPHEHSAEELP